MNGADFSAEKRERLLPSGLFGPVEIYEKA